LRLHELQRRLDDQAAAFNADCTGRTLQVLLERTGRHPGQLVGRTPYLQAVHVAAPGLQLGDLLPVKITECHAHSLGGVVARPAPTEKELPA
jgi:tRNA-2-methylthio-N6-dimethylallyladenosine synthase